MKEITKRKFCFNCKYASQPFKVKDFTHHHCYKPKYEEMAKNGDPPSGWETLRKFGDICSDHVFKNDV